jgi:hypothetical protein
MAYNIHEDLNVFVTSKFLVNNFNNDQSKVTIKFWPKIFK